MADIYVRSTDGDDADNGSTWALAKATLVGALAIDAPGDRIFLSQSHSESQSGAYTFANAGTNAAPNSVICADDSAEPPTASAATASIVSTTGGMTFQGQSYYQGISFTVGTNIMFDTFAGGQTFVNCEFITTNTGGSGHFTVVANNAINRTQFINCRFKFAGTANRIVTDGRARFLNCSIISGSFTPTNLFSFGSTTGRGSFAEVDNFDFSNLGATVNLLDPASILSGVARFRNCRFASAWSGNIYGATKPANPGARGEVYASGHTSADNSRSLAMDMTGSQFVNAETYRDGTRALNADGDPFSWSIYTNSACSFPMRVFETNEFAVWNDVVGTSRTVTVQILRDSVTALNDDEVWLEVSYNDSASHPHNSMASSFKADLLGAATAIPNSSETWTDWGLSNPYPQKLAVTFTPQLAGYITCRVCVAISSGLIFVDPDPVLS